MLIGFNSASSDSTSVYIESSEVLFVVDDIQDDEYKSCVITLKHNVSIGVLGTAYNVGKRIKEVIKKGGE